MNEDDTKAAFRLAATLGDTPAKTLLRALKEIASMRGIETANAAEVARNAIRAADELQTTMREMARPARVNDDGTKLVSFAKATADALATVAREIFDDGGIRHQTQRDKLLAALNTYDAVKDRDTERAALTDKPTTDPAALAKMVDDAELDD